MCQYMYLQLSSVVLIVYVWCVCCKRAVRIVSTALTTGRSISRYILPPSCRRPPTVPGNSFHIEFDSVVRIFSDWTLSVWKRTHILYDPRRWRQFTTPTFTCSEDVAAKNSTCPGSRAARCGGHSLVRAGQQRRTFPQALSVARRTETTTTVLVTRTDRESIRNVERIAEKLL